MANFDSSIKFAKLNQIHSGRGMPYVPRSHVVTITTADLSAAALVEILDITTDDLGAAFPADVRVLGGTARLLEEFDGPGVSACTFQLGDAVDTADLMAATDIYTGSGPDRFIWVFGPHVFGGWEGGYVARFQINTTGANVDQLNVGSIEVSIHYMTSTDPYA